MCLAAVWMAGIEGIYLPFPAFWLAGAAEAIGDAVSGGGGAAGACKGLAKVTVTWLLGVVGFVVLLIMSGA